MPRSKTEYLPYPDIVTGRIARVIPRTGGDIDTWDDVYVPLCKDNRYIANHEMARIKWGDREAPKYRKHYEQLVADGVHAARINLILSSIRALPRVGSDIANVGKFRALGTEAQVGVLASLWGTDAYARLLKHADPDAEDLMRRIVPLLEDLAGPDGICGIERLRDIAHRAVHELHVPDEEAEKPPEMGPIPAPGTSTHNPGHPTAQASRTAWTVLHEKDTKKTGRPSTRPGKIKPGGTDDGIIPTWKPTEPMTWDWTTRTGCYVPGPMRVRTSPMLHDLRRTRAYYERVKARKVDSGIIMTHPERWAIDKAVFRGPRKRSGTTDSIAILIDWSGSMGLAASEVLSLIEAAPFNAVVATYSFGHATAGVLDIVARNGRCVLPEALENHGGRNVIDVPALRWLAAQPQRVKMWVSDGGVTGIGVNSDGAYLGWDEPDANIERQCKAIKDRSGIIRVPNVDLALDMLRGKKDIRDYGFAEDLV